jgi:subtilisin family serine protease
MDPTKFALQIVVSSVLLLAASAIHDHGAAWTSGNMGEGVVIGVLDDSIDAGHPSFGDEGMLPPPARWRGRCKYAGAACNNKLVGARKFTRAGTHGTHTSSVAAGASVRRADVPGAVAVSGVAPRAHLAFYRVCAAQGCSRGPIMHAVETALADGVDVLSLSLGDDDGLSFQEDPAVAATFSAVMRGVVVCAAAGNKGPAPGSVTNDVPWILTVGASTSSHGSPHPAFAAAVPAFSSRGPSRNNGGVLKPDIVGPGVDILAAVPRCSSVSATTIDALLRSFASMLSIPAQRTAGAGKMIRFTWSSV